MGIILFSGCSVTKHLPEGEVLYTGGKTVIQNKSTTPVGGTALTEIEAALDKTCLLYTSPSPRDPKTSRMPSSA